MTPFDLFLYTVAIVGGLGVGAGICVAAIGGALWLWREVLL